MRLRFIFGSALIFLGIAACGPSRTMIRNFLQTSPHRSITVIPFDVAPGQKNYSTVSSDMMSFKLQRIGFLVPDAGKTKGLWNHAPAKGKFFDDAASAAAFGRGLGTKAVLVGTVDQAFEASQNVAATYTYETVYPPPCCSTIPRSCSQGFVFDPVLNASVDVCTVHHRRITDSPGIHNHLAGFSTRVRLIDTATSQVLWESHADSQSTNESLNRSADAIFDGLSDELLTALMNQHQ